MDTAIIEAQNRIKYKRNQTLSGQRKNKGTSNYISNLFTRTLISVIMVLGCAIFVNINDKNLLFFKNNLFNDTLAFAKINELYSKYFGSIVPDANSNILESGIVVFSGEKDGYGKTVIIQGIDGVDIWYSNLTNLNITMYDYVEKGDVLGEVDNNEIVLTFMENGEFTSYEKYISQS